MSNRTQHGKSSIALLIGLLFFVSTSALAKTFTLRIGGGHPSAPVPYVNLAETYFVPEVEKRVAERTEHKVRFIEAYGGTIAKLGEELEATEKGLLDIGLMCFCFEPTKAFAQNLNYYIPFSTPSAQQQLRVTRRIFDEFPQLKTHFEDNYNQRILALSGYDNYNLGTTFVWNKTEELAGHKIGGAGPNLPWIKFTGATAVQAALNEWYNGMQSGIYEGVLSFPASYYGFRLHEVAPHYKIINIGAVIVNGMNISLRTVKKLPPEVLAIIEEVAAEYEIEVANRLDVKQKEGLEKLQEDGAIITELPEDQRAAWAEKLKDFPNEMAQEVNRLGFPGTEIFRKYIEYLEADGYRFPVRYEIK